MKQLFKKKGFTLIELLGVIVILGILITIGAVAVSTAIDSANQTKVQADLKNFSDAISYMLTENPQIGRKTGYQNTAVLRLYNESVGAEMQIAIDRCGDDNTLVEGGGTLTALRDITETTVVSTYTVDPWGVPYKIYVQGNNLSATGRNGGEVDTPDAELRFFVVSNGKNTIGSDSPNLLDSDDVCMLVESVNGEIRTGYYNAGTNADIDTIFWFSEDVSGFNQDLALNVTDKESILNMNYACLKPVALDE